MIDKAPPCSPEAEMAVLGGMLIDREAAALAAAELEPEEFYVSPHRLLFKNLKAMVQRDEALDEITVSAQLRETEDFDSVGGVGFLASLLDSVPTAANVAYHISVVKDRYAKRSLLQVAAKIIDSVEGAKWSAPKIVESALLRLGEITPQVRQRILTRQQIVSAERERMHAPFDPSTRVGFPFAKLNDYVGLLVPGDTVGIAGYMNSGKTQFTAALVRHWAISDIPCRWYPTESAERFFSRVASAHARVDQRYAERDLWHLASDEEKEAYDFALADLESMPWELNPQLDISPEEIIADATLWLKRVGVDPATGLPRPTVLVVDHMHRLNYGPGVEPAIAVRAATKQLRNWAKAHGVILILIYQPKKPPVNVQVYKPVMGYQISGDVAHELDIILSPYRRWVKVEPAWRTNPLLRTPWGTPRCLLVDGHPKPCKPEAEDGKVDDEHMYVKIPKRRTGGEGPTLVFQIEAPSGFIYQVTSTREAPGELTGTG